MDDSGPADANPPEPEVIVAVPEPVSVILAESTTLLERVIEALLTTILEPLLVTKVNEPAPVEKNPSVAAAPIANAGVPKAPKAVDTNRPLVNVALPVVTDNPPVDIVTPEPLEKVLAPEIV